MRHITIGVIAMLGAGCSESSPSSGGPTRALEQALPVAEQQKLQASDAYWGEYFGTSVALSAGFGFVGAPRHSARRGAVYVYNRSASPWVEKQQLLAPDGEQGDEFATRLAVSGTTLIVGVLNDNAAQGSAHVFELAGDAWEHVQALAPADAMTGDFFGSALAISGDTAFVSSGQGIYVFSRSGGAWTQTQKVVISTRRTAPRLAASADTLLAGTCDPDFPTVCLGAVLVYGRTGTTFSLQQKLVPNERQPNDAFGAAVALSGDTALIGVPEHSARFIQQGAVYVFLRNAGIFAQAQKLTASDGTSEDRFGESVSLQQGAALVGAGFHEHQGVNRNQGSAYLFTRSGTGFAEASEIRASDGQNGDLFGSALTYSGGIALIGSLNDDGPYQAQGSAYVFMLGNVDGQACASGSECASGVCSDGFCCESACSDGCLACSNALTGAPNGKCAPVLAGSDPRNACDPDSGSPNSCGGDGSCDGAGACRTVTPAGTPCDSLCVAGVAREFTCDGTGQCLDSSIACGNPFRQISAGGAHTCGVRADGSLSCWGFGQYFWGDAQAPSAKYREVAAGAQFTCALRTDGSVDCWYGNGSVQLGNPAFKFLSISADDSDSACGIRDDGTLACWGANYYGESNPPSGMFRSVSPAPRRACGIRLDGTLACWGSAEDGPPPLGPFELVDGAQQQTCALRIDGSIQCWGDPQSHLVSPPEGTFRAMSVYEASACAIRLDGTLACWGNNSNGQISPPALTFQAVALGGTHGCGLRHNGSIACWGNNGEGQATPPL